MNPRQWSLTMVLQLVDVDDVGLVLQHDISLEVSHDHQDLPAHLSLFAAGD